MTMPSEVFGGTSVKKRALTNKHFLTWKMLLKTDNLLPFVCFHILYITYSRSTVARYFFQFIRSQKTMPNSLSF